MRNAGRSRDEEYRRLARWRSALRRFLRFSETAARREGLSPSQHQLLLFIRGYGGPGCPSIGDLAALLQLRHQSAVGLIDRCESAGLVRRRRDAEDARRVRIEITARGERVLERLTREHRRELASLKDTFSMNLDPAPGRKRQPDARAAKTSGPRS